MREPAQTLVGELERIVSALPDAVLFPGLGAEGAAPLRGRHGRAAASGPGDVPGGARRRRAVARCAPADDRRGGRALAAARPRALGRGALAGRLWPVAERAGRRYALDAEEASGDGEWPVVEVTEHGVDRVGTSFLRFLHVLCAELAAGSAAGEARPSRSRRRAASAIPGTPITGWIWRSCWTPPGARPRSTRRWPPRCAPRRRRRRR